MANIQEVNTKDISVQTEDTQQQTQDPILEAAESLNTEYNKSIEELTPAETAVQDAQTKVFKLLLDLSKKSPIDIKSSDAYNELFLELVDLKEDVYNKQSNSFRLLQKLRQAHTTYLMAVINTLQKENAELKKSA